jgi:ParB-like chromosome segregation protein Spo0J
MNIYEPHPFAKDFPPIEADELDRLIADIKANGLQQPITLYQGKILDGNNRQRACIRAAVAPKYWEFPGKDAQAQAYVVSANIHRRHLTAEQKRDLLAKLIKADPSKSNRLIAETAKVDHKTAGAVRTELEQRGEIPHVGNRTDSAGRTQPAKKKSGKKSGAKSEKETITYQKVINTKTALNAYCVLEEHLLDALRDVKEKSDFSQADDCGRRTIEKLEECLGEMQPEEEKEAA